MGGEGRGRERKGGEFKRGKGRGEKGVGIGGERAPWAMGGMDAPDCSCSIYMLPRSRSSGSKPVRNDCYC